MSHLWFESGFNHNKSRSYYDITKLAAGMDFKKALPDIHAFTRSDYTPSFHRKGKVRPLKLMLKHPKFVEVFSSIGEEPNTPAL